MKRLFDQNLSYRLVDSPIWAHAIEHGFAIVSKDQDFAERAIVEGPPPKVVWIQLGNCSTAAIRSMLRERSTELADFANDDAPLLSLA